MAPPREEGLTAALVASTAAVATRILYGAPVFERRHPKGSVALFAPGQLVLYLIQARRPRGFLFRTLRRPEPVSTQLPGVRPQVRLLLQTQTFGRLRKLEDLFRYLGRKGRNPDALTDGFYLRLAVVLAGRLPRAKILQSLLDRDADTESP